MLPTADVGVIGSINQDVVINVRHIPQPGETVTDGTLSVLPGGKGANQAVAAVACGSTTALYGAVGDDANGDSLLAHLRNRKVDVTAVTVLPGVATGMASIWVDSDGENSIAVVGGANRKVMPDGPALDAFIAGRKAIVANTEVPLGTVEIACKLAKKAGIPMIVNLAPFKQLSPYAAACVHTLIVNEIEASQFTTMSVTDVESAKKAATSAVQSAGLANAVITLGAEGAVLAVSGSSGPTHFPAPSVDVVDTTGAGDEFVGAYAAAIAGGATPTEAVATAVQTASASVQHPGAQPQE